MPRSFHAADQRKQEARTKAGTEKGQERLAGISHAPRRATPCGWPNNWRDLTGLESRVTILGYVQRGGSPSAVDRLLATRLGTACADLISEGVHGVMVASRGDKTEPVPLEKVAGKRKTVPLDHPWITSARLVGTSLGD